MSATVTMSGCGGGGGEGRLKQLTFRLAPDLIGRLDDHAAQLTRTTLGMRFSRTDVVRMLLESGLEGAGFGREG